MKTLALAAAIAAILTPVASATTERQVIWVDGHTAWLAVGYPADAQGYRLITDTLAPGGTAHRQSAQNPAFITDTLAPGGKTHTEAVQSYRLITDTLAPGGGPSLVVTNDRSGFSWADAGIGAGAATGALFLVAGGAMFTRRRRGALAF